MLTQRPTADMVKEWKKSFDENQRCMKENRKTGLDVDSYFRSKYPFTVLESSEYTDIVTANIVQNEFNAEKLPKGEQPKIKTYMVDDVLVGIDIVTGYFQIESEDIQKIAPIYDDLFVYRGLDRFDLQNYYLVAEYIRLTKR